MIRPGKSFLRPSRNTRSTMMIGKTMQCSFVTVLQVLSFLFLRFNLFIKTVIERCLSYDEKPLLLFQKLKDAKKNPVFMLKHIKDIRSPIAVAQQKHAARKAIDAGNSPSSRNASGSGHSASRSISTRPSKLQVHNLSATNGTPPLNSAATTQAPAWPEVMSPSAEQKDKLEEAGADISTRSLASTSTAVNSSVAGTEETTESNPGFSSHGAVASTGISYSVAIYPYMAEQEDEFDVVV